MNIIMQIGSFPRAEPSLNEDQTSAWYRGGSVHRCELPPHELAHVWLDLFLVERMVHWLAKHKVTGWRALRQDSCLHATPNLLALPCSPSAQLPQAVQDQRWDQGLERSYSAERSV